MAGSISIGGVNVPVVAHVNRTGDVSAANAGSAIISATGLTNPALFDAGVTIGIMTASSPSGGGEGPHTQSTYLPGGRTTLDDSSELIVTAPYDQGSGQYGPGKASDGLISHQDGETAVQIASFSQLSVAEAINQGAAGSSRIYTTNLVAISASWDGASTEPTRVNAYVVISICEQVNISAVGNVTINYYQRSVWYINIPYYNKANNLYMHFEEVPEPEDDPNDEDDPSDEGGGDGNHTPIYDPIPIPDRPNMGAANAGFITMYKLGLAAINTFASDMFASNVWEAIRLFFSNPIDFLVGCMLLPFEPETGSSYHPKFGIVAFEHAYPAVSNQYKDIDCGSINISKYWGSCFDYEPYTKIQIWLPYIGYRELPVDEIMDMTVSVKYRCDCLTGDCVAFVYTGVVGQTGPQVERVIGQFYGNCGVRVPFGSVSYDSAVAASISLIGAAATTGLSAGAGAMSQTGGAVGGLMAGADAVMTDGNVRSASIGVVQGLKPNVHKGGAAGASTGYMSIQKPYIIKRIPRQNLPTNYMNLKGYPSNIGGTLSQFTGLAVVDDIQLNNIPAMEDERKEIIKWLRGGVLI